MKTATFAPLVLARKSCAIALSAGPIETPPKAVLPRSIVWYATRLFQLGVSLLWMTLCAAPNALAATTTLNFDTTPDGSMIQSGASIVNQYQSVGVATTGATALNASQISLTANTAPNVAYALSGLMGFFLNPSITGNVQSVSAYITGPVGVGIYAYDASNALVGTAQLNAEAPAPTLLSVTSLTGDPIVSVQIHDGGAQFLVDTVTFATADVPFAKFGAVLYLAPKISAFASAETFTLGERNTTLNPTTQKVTLRIGALTLTLPPGSFSEDGPPRRGSYVFRGALNGVNLYVSITPTRAPKTYVLFVLGAGYTFPNAVTSMRVGLNIGDNAGAADVKPNYVPRPPSSPE
ncbi:hypothetical protein Q8F57_033330 [Paraburkholderia terrae]|uniref:hypothetical protein n=1 Tax=Paraburkholderia terrae TaxID=311230 RepID=UPI00296B0EB7|nr:hypothetical protein [Paraburkholderia terrae]MDW3662808.1 hypothetical protein [Paraburkholderia terrae]